ncbi:hypothetical protein GOA89_11400 [Sinorhizobium meliloti]|nr:hypothetical protein [Sinorhizobium meliloti]MDW9846908.1 hypothetical protein [Sinorhizobium meliloti]MDX0143712.1 hypothetical protein [Sinorhizobium meliloti]MDX0149737.1 hypothetical protein [Sinorhizobium meliloti]MDX0168988.1 hypothetical protein [Sinorhizobium meliloti]
MENLSEHPFSPESIARESGEPDSSERAWLKWCATVERMLGHDLDGNQAEDGYSLDYAYEAFLKGHKPPSYVAGVQKLKAGA